MSPRVPGFGRDPSPHDSTAPPGRGDKRRPLGVNHPVVPHSTRPVKGFARAAARLLIAALVLGVVFAAVWVALSESKAPTPPPNQPTVVTP